MQTSLGQLTFCTNIFPGETWETHFEALKSNIPRIKKQLSPGGGFGIGLRLSNKASLQLSKEESLTAFKRWLQQEDCYIVAINGFPYGNFHGTRVKDQVHAPDWTTNERLQYTLRLFRILAGLIPGNRAGGVSTSPLSYKHWFAGEEAVDAMEKSTWNIVEVVCSLIHIRKNTGKVLHLDLEPEADGLIESSAEFLQWYTEYLLPLGVPVIQDRTGLSEADAVSAIKAHVRLCYDVCHFAVGFEEAEAVLEKLKRAGIQVGRWQLSAALRITMNGGDSETEDPLKGLEEFNEPVYLHQVVARQKNGILLRYPDLPGALSDEKARGSEEWRSHFHVPLFVGEYGALKSTREEVVRALSLQRHDPVCDILEVETYTWEVLPGELKLPLAESIIREMQWVIGEIGA